jgi:hypothetical protein
MNGSYKKDIVRQKYNNINNIDCQAIVSKPNYLYLQISTLIIPVT